MLIRIGFTLALGTLLGATAAAGESQGGHLRELIAECEACHGPSGVSEQEDVPSLAGQSATYLRELLDQFYNYERHCPTTTYRQGDRPKTPQSMCSVANALSEEDQAALAEYFSKLELPGSVD